MGLSFLVLTRNRREDLRRCLDSIISQAPAGAPLLVLVNGTEDDTTEMLARDYGHVRVEVQAENLGCPGGRNLGIRLAETEWVMCVDDDGWLPEGSVEAALDAISRVPSAAIIGGPVIEFPSERPTGDLQRTGLFTGGICVAHRGKFLSHGGYHEDGLRQGEESELAIRLAQGGEEIWHSPQMRLVHATDRSPEKRREIIRSGTRQAILTGIKYAPLRVLLPYLAIRWLSFAKVGVRWGIPMSVVKGSVDAFRLAVPTWRRRSPVSMRALLAVSGRFPSRDRHQPS
ncbi:glycosyltransferase [Nocardioides sp. 1609]|uniref:glycosyltransferase family 2 protein n=1 Tax=Nocardioides sp. 1609 TaxID=2508327 RepID=UPI0024696D18|nr:glycosyltransferase [Nocardioides sp. 1609]